MRFPSAEWADAFRAALNENPEYRDAAAAWEGEILFRVSTGTGGAAPGIHLALAHGACSAATFHPDSSSVASEFVYEGSAENWGRLLRGELDPVKAILDGTFRMRGNLLKASRFTRAAKALVETAASVPADSIGPV
ncbi:MAG: SCP2 sterol-binding domain-containing protein [Thermoplasmata archaeon]